jgi:hypothetical protein
MGRNDASEVVPAGRVRGHRRAQSRGAAGCAGRGVPAHRRRQLARSVVGRPRLPPAADRGCRGRVAARGRGARRTGGTDRYRESGRERPAGAQHDTIVEGPVERRPEGVVFVNAIPPVCIEPQHAVDAPAAIRKARQPTGAYQPQPPTSLADEAVRIGSDDHEGGRWRAAPRVAFVLSELIIPLAYRALRRLCHVSLAGRRFRPGPVVSARRYPSGPGAGRRTGSCRRRPPVGRAT